MEKLFLLDAYALIYRAYYAFIKNPRINSKGLNTSAIMGFVNTLNEVITKEKPTHLGVAFDPKGPTFRHEAYAKYKAQREETPEDIKKAVPIIKEILNAYNIPILEVEGYEADDVIGTLATKAGEKGITTYMMTPDKDYGQLVKDNVFMYRPRYGDNGFDVLGPKEVEEKYGVDTTIQIIDLLGLMGDSSDNIPGCPGVGPKTATKLIKEYGSIEGIIENSGNLKGSIKEKIETNKQMIIFSKFLATIKIDVPIELDLDALKKEEPNETELRKLFEKLELHSLADRILNKPEKKEKKVELQGDLFSEFQPSGEESHKNSSFESLKTLKHEYHLVESEEDAKKLYDYLRTFEILSLDTETTSTEAIDAELVGLSFAVEENKAWYVAIPSKREEAEKFVNIFKPLYEDENILKVGQNIKYDMEVLRNYGVNLAGKMFDTMIAHYVIQPELHHGMDYLAEIYLNYQTVHIEELIGPKGKNQGNMRDLLPSQVYEYACEDADVTLKLKNKLEPELKKVSAEDLFYNIEMPLVPVLAEIEMNGVKINTDTLKETSNIFTERMKILEEKIYNLAGEHFNIASPKQVGDILFGKMQIMDKPKKTKTGQYVTSEDVLQSLRGKSEIVKDILDHRGLKKLLGTYVDALPLLINKRTGHIHTSFNQTITATGRLSSSNPNLQNIPVRDDDGKEIRKAFIPDEGCLFFSADYSQIELRVMAHLSNDTNMIEAFNEGQDIHSATAAKVYKEDIKDVTEDQRRKAKRANFGIIYGITVFGLAERLEIDRHEAKELIDGYFDTYPQIHDYMQRNIEIARKQGYIETVFKRRRYLPDINSHNATVRGFAERNAINAPIQGSAADIIKVAMIRIYNRFKTEKIRSKMILQVHDELNFSVFPDEKEKVEKIVMEEMQGAYKMSVPLIADCGWGNNWLEAH
jgi:DNA polymerase-1